jgi:hypothetical protein
VLTELRPFCLEKDRKRAQVSMATQVGGETAAPVTKQTKNVGENFPGPRQRNERAACPGEGPRASTAQLSVGDPEAGA